MLTYIQYVEYLNWLKKNYINTKPQRHLEMTNREECNKKKAIHRAGYVEMDMCILVIHVLEYTYMHIFQMNINENKFPLEMYREQRMVPKYSLFQVSSQTQSTKLITVSFHFPNNNLLLPAYCCDALVVFLELVKYMETYSAHEDRQTK